MENVQWFFGLVVCCFFLNSTLNLWSMRGATHMYHQARFSPSIRIKNWRQTGDICIPTRHYQVVLNIPRTAPPPSLLTKPNQLPAKLYYLLPAKQQDCHVNLLVSSIHTHAPGVSHARCETEAQENHQHKICNCLCYRGLQTDFKHTGKLLMKMCRLDYNTFFTLQMCF